MKIKFVPQNIEIENDPEMSVLQQAQKNGVFIKSICNGLPNCAECRIKVVDGEHNVMPPFSKELQLIGSGHYIDQRRLSCQMYCFGDVTIDLTEQMEKEQTLGSKRPQGSNKSTEEESYAVTGSLLDQEKDLVEETKENVSESKNRRRSRKPSGPREGSLESRASGQNSEKKEHPKKAESSDKTPSQSRNRNRNRNRNRRRRQAKTESE